MCGGGGYVCVSDLCFSVHEQRPPHSFQPKMKLELVDKRNPMLVRVATVVDRDDHRIKVRAEKYTPYSYCPDGGSTDFTFVTHLSGFAHSSSFCSRSGFSCRTPATPVLMFWCKRFIRKPQLRSVMILRYFYAPRLCTG